MPLNPANMPVIFSVEPPSCSPQDGTIRDEGSHQAVLEARNRRGQDTAYAEWEAKIKKKSLYQRRSLTHRLFIFGHEAELRNNTQHRYIATILFLFLYILVAVVGGCCGLLSGIPEHFMA